MAAKTADHVSPLSLHEHVLGSGRRSLIGTCLSCQRRQAAP
jgi:hypothetical protein